jgi:outer membrane protein OmpA-like peptidoglycan-associated protein
VANRISRFPTGPARDVTPSAALRTPKPAHLTLQRALGNQRVQALGSSRAIQAKLRVSQPDDPYEREADRVADTVMRMPAPCPTCADDESPCPKCAAKSAASLQRKEYGSSATHDGGQAPDGLLQGLGPGRPLDAPARSFFEPRFGRDFGDVRLHTGTRAAESARAVNALAYTVGRDVVFGAGAYAPHTSAGRRLMAHELTHVLQQSGAPSPTIQRSCGPALGAPSPACDPATSSPLGERFLFEVNCDDLKPGEPAHLSFFALTLTPGSTLRVHGFASVDGPAGFNMELSCHRANKLAGLLAAARPDVTVVSPNVMHGETPGPAADNRSVIVETALAQRPSCGPDATDWFIAQVTAAKTDPAVLDIQADLRDAHRETTAIGLTSERIVEGAVLEKVLAEETRAGRPTRTAIASAQIAAAGPGAAQLALAKMRAVFEALGPLSPGGPRLPHAIQALLLLRRAALNWKALVRTGARYDFKNDPRTMRNPTSTSCPADCAGTITFCPMSSADCFLTDVPGNLFYAHIGGWVGFSELALQLGSQFAQLDSTATWDPPEDTSMIALGFALPDPLTRADLCSRVQSSRSIFTSRPCDTCSEPTTAAIV